VGVFNLPPNSSNITDGFIQKLDSLGQFIWAKKIGGPHYDIGKNIYVGNNFEFYAAGFFRDSVDFDFDTSSYFLYGDTIFPGGFYTAKWEQNGSNFPSGILGENPHTEVLVYPNPSNGKFRVHVNFEAPDYSLEVFTLSGIRIFSQTHIQKEISGFDISLRPGLYFLRIKAANEMFSKKQIIE